MDPSNIPPEVLQAINKLRKEAAEKNRLAGELERHYTGKSGGGYSSFQRATSAPPPPNYSGQAEVAPISSNAQEVALKAEDIIRYVRTRGARPSGLADYFHVPIDTILAIIHAPKSGLVIAERGWVKEAEQPNLL